MEVKKRLLNNYEFAKELGITVPTLTRYMKMGYIEPTKFSLTGRHLYSEEYVDYIKNNLDEIKEDVKGIPIDSVAKIMGVCNSTVNKYIKKGLLKPIDENAKHPKFRRKDVEELNEICGSTNFDNLITVGEMSEIWNIGSETIWKVIDKMGIKAERETPTGRKFYNKEWVYKALNQKINDDCFEKLEG